MQPAYVKKYFLTALNATPEVLEAFLKAIPADRLSAAGYAEFHPVAGNDTPEGRAQNRRVDLVVQPRSRLNFSQPDSPPSTGAWRKITDDQ